MEVEKIVLKFKKSDLDFSGYYYSSNLYDWCKKNKIKIEEPQNKEGLYDRFIIHLDTIEKQYLFSGKYLTLLKKVAAKQNPKSEYLTLNK